MEQDEEVTSKKGRPSIGYDTGFVRDISMQVLIAFYNGRPETLRKQIERDPDYVSKLREKAKYMDATALRWLVAMDSKPSTRSELMFRAWCLGLDQPRSPVWMIENPIMAQELRNIAMKHMTDWHWQTNCKRWVDAVNRVRQDKFEHLLVPTIKHFEDDDGDDFL